MRSSQDGKWMMRWSSTERLTLLNKMMKLASAVYNVQYRKARCLKSRAKRGCTSDVRRIYMQILSLLYPEVVSFPQYVAG